MHQRRVVELRVVREHGDRGRAVDAAEPRERLLRPRGDDLLGVREARGLREAGARVDHERPPAGGAREPAQRGGEVDGAEDDQPRRRERDVDEQHVSPSSRRSERSTHISSSACRAAASSSAGVAERCRASRRRRATSILPPARRPGEHA